MRATRAHIAAIARIVVGERERVPPRPHRSAWGARSGRVAMTLSRNRFLTAIDGADPRGRHGPAGRLGRPRRRRGRLRRPSVPSCRQLGQPDQRSQPADPLGRRGPDGPRTVYGFTEDLGVLARAASRPGRRSGAGVAPVPGGRLRLGHRRCRRRRLRGGRLPAPVRRVLRLTEPRRAAWAPSTACERDGVHRLVPRAQTAALVADGWVSDGASLLRSPPTRSRPTRRRPVPPTPSPTPTPPPDADDLTFSIAVIPDTQDEVQLEHGHPVREPGRPGWSTTGPASTCATRCRSVT